MELATSPDLAPRGTERDGFDVALNKTHNDFEQEMVAGRSSSLKAIPCRFLYDQTGSIALRVRSSLNNAAMQRPRDLSSRGFPSLATGVWGSSSRT